MRLRILAAAMAAWAVSGPAVAEGPAPFPDFSAKRVKPPKPGTRQRITVQIAPTPSPAPAAAAVATAAVATAPRRAGGSGSYEWFWEVISPKLDATGPGRLEPALVRLQTPPAGQGVAAPRLQVLQDIAARHGADILRSTVGTQVSPALALAVISVESAGRADAVSGAGAQGLMQLMPATAKRFGVDDSFAPAQNIKGGVAFLDFLMTKFRGDPILVLAGGLDHATSGRVDHRGNAS